MKSTNAAGRFFILLSERLIAALGIILNSLLLGRLASSETAAAYFFVTSATQLMTPWVPAAEIAWLGDKGRGRSVTELLVPNVIGMTIVSITLSLGAASVFAFYKHINISAAFVCFGGYLSYVFVPTLLASKFSNMRAYVAVMMGSALLGAAIKSFYLFWLNPGVLLTFVLFIEWFLVGICCILLRRKDVVKGVANLTKMRSFYPGLLAAASSVIAMLVASRIVMPVAGFYLSEKDYASFGISFQVLNTASFVAAALTGSLAALLRGADQQASGVGTRVFLATLATILLVSALGYLMWLKIGLNIIEILKLKNPTSIFKFVAIGYPASIALLFQGAAMAWASVFAQVKVFVAGCITFSFLSLSMFMLIPGSTSFKVMMWADVQLLGAVIVCLIVFLQSSRRYVINGLLRSWDER